MSPGTVTMWHLSARAEVIAVTSLHPAQSIFTEGIDLKASIEYRIVGRGSTPVSLIRPEKMLTTRSRSEGRMDSLASDKQLKDLS